MSSQKTNFIRGLREKLPPKTIKVRIQEKVVVYYDFHGVTFGETEEENQIVEDYIIEVVSHKIGFPIRITDWGCSNNGHFAHSFEKV